MFDGVEKCTFFIDPVGHLQGSAQAGSAGTVTTRNDYSSIVISGHPFGTRRRGCSQCGAIEIMNFYSLARFHSRWDEYSHVLFTFYLSSATFVIGLVDTHERAFSWLVRRNV